jgi:hypothetical protein
MGDAIGWLDTIPGVDVVASRALLAEIGTNMEQFPTAKHCASNHGCHASSWVPVCAARHGESSGKAAGSAFTAPQSRKDIGDADSIRRLAGSFNRVTCRYLTTVVRKLEGTIRELVSMRASV